MTRVRSHASGIAQRPALLESVGEPPPSRLWLLSHPHVHGWDLELDRLRSTGQLDAHSQESPAAYADVAAILDDGRDNVTAAEGESLEVAALLKLAGKTVYAIAQAGEIPAFKICEQWRIKRAAFDQWVDAQPRGGDGGGRGE